MKCRSPIRTISIFTPLLSLVESMNHKDFISKLSERAGRSYKQTDALVGALVTSLVKELEETHNVDLPGLGRFEVEKELEKIVESPSDGTRLLIPPMLVIRFEANVDEKNVPQTEVPTNSADL